MSLARLRAGACRAALAACAALAGCGSAGRPPAAPESHPAHREATHAVPATRTRRILIPTGAGHLAAMAGERGLTLRERPNGRVIAHLRAYTAYGSQTVVWAAAQRGRWLGVVAASVPDNRLGWLNVDHDRPRLWRSPYELVADLSNLSVELRRGAHLVRVIPVTIGSPDTPTPTGRFEVTDKLLPERSSGYGCCILALSGHQSRLRPGWAGGDRMAIHGSPAQLVGTAASAGCLRARDTDLRTLMRVVPLGTPVFIRA